MAVLATYVLGVVLAWLGASVAGALVPADASGWTGLGYALSGAAAGVALAVLVAATLAFRMGLGLAFGVVTAAVAVAAVVLQPTFRDAFIPLLLAAPVLGGAAAVPLRARRP